MLHETARKSPKNASLALNWRFSDLEENLDSGAGNSYIVFDFRFAIFDFYIANRSGSAAGSIENCFVTCF